MKPEEARVDKVRKGGALKLQAAARRVVVDQASLDSIVVEDGSTEQ